MTHLDAQERTCIFCEHAVNLDQIAWMIDENLLRAQIPDKGEGAPGSAAFWDAIGRFAYFDQRGTTFYAAMSGKHRQRDQAAPPILVVFPNNLEPSTKTGERSLNTYTTQSDQTIPIFQLPELNAGDPHLRFTDPFVRAMQEAGLECFQIENSRRYIEEICIRPVCPECMSYVPEELLDEADQNTYVARLAYIGPIGSGKTTLNWANLVFDAFNRGGWQQNVKDLYTTTHYLARNFYEMLVREKKLPTRTQKEEYNPPLLVRLRRKNKKILLVLFDVAGELLQQISQQCAAGGESLQTFAYTKMIQNVDGFLLMLDSDMEVLPKVNIVNSKKSDDSSGEKEASPVTLLELVRSYTSSGNFDKKPAALVLTKCDQLFQGAMGGDFQKAYDELFSMFSPVERAFWQKPESAAYCQRKISYEADYHECIQLPFKAFVREWFPQLWNVLEDGFSRVDVFPEASLGISIGNNPEEMFDVEKLKPFRTAAPIFWLLDMIDFGRPAES